MYVYHDHYDVCIPWPPCHDLLFQPARGPPHPLALIHFLVPTSRTRSTQNLSALLCSLLFWKILTFGFLIHKDSPYDRESKLVHIYAILGPGNRPFPPQFSEGSCVLLFTYKMWALSAKMSKGQHLVSQAVTFHCMGFGARETWVLISALP